MNKYKVDLSSSQTVISKTTVEVVAKDEQHAIEKALEEAYNGWARWQVVHSEDYTVNPDCVTKIGETKDE